MANKQNKQTRGNSRFSERTKERERTVVVPDAPKESELTEAHRHVEAAKKLGKPAPKRWLAVIEADKAARKAVGDKLVHDAEAARERDEVHRAEAHFEGTVFSVVKGLDALELFNDSDARSFATATRTDARLNGRYGWMAPLGWVS